MLWLVWQEKRQVLGHFSALDGGDADLLEGFCESSQRIVAIELGAVAEPAGPGEDRGDRIGRGLLAPLIGTVVARYRAVCRFGLNSLSVRRLQHGGHQAEGSKTLRQRVGLHVAIVIFARPDKSTVPFQCGRDHVVDQAVLIDNASSLEVCLELVVEDFLKEILEASVISFENGIFGRHVEWPLSLQRKSHAGTRKITNR